MRMKITILDSTDTTKSLVYEFEAKNEGDIGRAVQDAGRNFRMDYPDVDFDNKQISLDRA